MDSSSKDQIFKIIDKYEFQQNSSFVLGSDVIHFSGRIYDKSEVLNLVDSALDFWITSGPYSKEFEAKFADYMSQKYCLLVNSGSSANLVAFSSLTSPMLEKL